MKHVRNYTPDQARDEHGRWTSGGGGGFASRPNLKSFTVFHGTAESLLCRKKLTVNPFVSEAQRKACYAGAMPGVDCDEWNRKTKGKLIRKKRHVNNVSTLKYDPSRTLHLRRQLSLELKRRFSKLRGKLRKLIVVDDAFGLVANCGGPGGKPGPCPEEGRLHYLVAGMKAKIHEKYVKLEARYGPKFAKAIIGAALAGLPIPVPGASILAAAPMLALAELHHQLTRNADSAMIAGIALQAVDTRRVLMLQRSDTKEWEFPGGHVQTGETIEQGAIREWQEETGLNFRGKLLPMWRWTTPTYNGHYVGMLAECPSELTFGALPAETSALKWVKPSELKDLDLRPSVRASLPTFLPMLRMDASERGTFEDALIREEARALLQSLTVTVNKTYAFVTDPEKVRQFQAWLRTQISVAGLSDEQLWQRYAEAGFRKGAARSYDDVSAKQLRDPSRSDDFYKGGRAQFLESSFNRPETVDKVKLLAGRSYSDMKGVTDAMATRMSRKLVDGLVEGKNPREIGSDIDDELDLAEGRATTIARTEIVRAHAEGQLDSLKELGVDDVGVEVEFATADDEDVCDECADLEGDTYSVDDAHGVIPVHPNCRCAFIPAGDALKL